MVAYDWKAQDRLIDRFQLEIHADRNFFMSRDWKKVWSLSKEIQESFKSIRYPTREQRQAAWERFQALRSEAAQAEEDERKQCVRRSADHRAHIIRLANLGTPKWHDNFFLLTFDDLKAFGAELKKAGEYLSEYKLEMIAEHKNECFAAIRSAREELNAWFEKVKAARTQRAQEWKARAQLRIEKNRARYAEKAAALQRMESKAQELRRNIATAWNQGYIERASGWLLELEEKINNLKNFLREIENWIEEDKSKLAR